jgi:cobalamin biosynthesis protein CbiG
MTGSRRSSVVVGVGMSSKATADEVRALVTTALREHRLDLNDVAVVATRERFVGDRRLDLGPTVTGVPDDVLVAASEPCDRVVGLPARVAETAAVVTVGDATATLIGPVARSPHATVAIAATATVSQLLSRLNR